MNPRLGQLLHHDPVALDLVQLELDQDKAEAAEQRKRRAYNETTRVGLALALSVDQVLQRREASEVEWIDWLNAAMAEQRAETPQEIMPAICARLEERAALLGREAARIVATEIIQEDCGGRQMSARERLALLGDRADAMTKWQAQAEEDAEREAREKQEARGRVSVSPTIAALRAS